MTDTHLDRKNDDNTLSNQSMRTVSSLDVLSRKVNGLFWDGHPHAAGNVDRDMRPVFIHNEFDLTKLAELRFTLFFKSRLINSL